MHTWIWLCYWLLIGDKPVSEILDDDRVFWCKHASTTTQHPFIRRSLTLYRTEIINPLDGRSTLITEIYTTTANIGTYISPYDNVLVDQIDIHTYCTIRWVMQCLDVKHMIVWPRGTLVLLLQLDPIHCMCWNPTRMANLMWRFMGSWGPYYYCKLTL